MTERIIWEDKTPPKKNDIGYFSTRIDVHEASHSLSSRERISFLLGYGITYEKKATNGREDSLHSDQHPYIHVALQQHRTGVWMIGAINLRDPEEAIFSHNVQAGSSLAFGFGREPAGVDFAFELQGSPPFMSRHQSTLSLNFSSEHCSVQVWNGQSGQTQKKPRAHTCVWTLGK
jgi:hypothetical protein